MQKYFLLFNFLIAIFIICDAKAGTGIGHDFFANLPDNSWTKVPTQDNPKREGHAGIAIDNKNGKLYIFGSDTHGDEAPDNSIHTLDLSTFQWSQSYTPDPLSNYLQDDDGWTITTTGRPWAAHIYYNMVFLPELNALFVHTAPYHNYTGVGSANIDRATIAKQSWLYYINDNLWIPLKDSNPPKVWAQGLSYNPKLNRIIGQNNRDTTYLFNPESLVWELTSSDGTHSSGIEASAGFNPISQKSFRFAGNYPLSTQITEYNEIDSTWKKLETSGILPTTLRGGQPMAVDTVNNVLIYHAQNGNEDSNTDDYSTTWILNLTTNIWENITPTIHPPNPGFNFMMTFYEKENVALYYVNVVEPNIGRKPELWAYRYQSNNTRAKSVVINPILLLLL